MRAVPKPAGADAVFRAFSEIDAQRQWSDAGCPQPIQHRDVEAWCRTMRFPLHPAEIVAVLTLDAERRAFDAQRRQRGRADDEDDE